MAGAVGVVAVAALLVVVVVVTGSAREERLLAAVPAEGCNGSVALCDRQLNEVAFAGTHNSFSAADSPGWFIANQLRTITRQLDDGIRLLLIDAHWGVQDANGKVLTDFDAEERDRNRVAKALRPRCSRRPSGSRHRLGGTTAEGEADVWLCHTVCELGATRMADSLGDIASSSRPTPARS